MHKYLIHCDLQNPGRDFERLNTTVMSFSDCIPLSRSCWAVKSFLNVTQIRDVLRPFLDRGDKLFVCAIDRWDGCGLPREILDWLQS